MAAISISSDVLQPITLYCMRPCICICLKETWLATQKPCKWCEVRFSRAVSQALHGNFAEACQCYSWMHSTVSTECISRLEPQWSSTGQFIICLVRSSSGLQVLRLFRNQRKGRRFQADSKGSRSGSSPVCRAESSPVCRHFGREIAAYDIQTKRVDVYGQDQGYAERTMVIYDGLHYDALAQAGAFTILPSWKRPKPQILNPKP